MSGTTSEPVKIVPGMALKKPLMLLSIAETENNGFVVYDGKCEPNMRSRILGAFTNFEEMMSWLAHRRMEGES